MGVNFIEPGQGVERTRDGMHEIEETDWRKKEEGRRRRMENVNFLTCFAKKMFIAPFADFEDRTEWLLRFTESPSSFWLVISDWNRGGRNRKQSQVSPPPQLLFQQGRQTGCLSFRDELRALSIFFSALPLQSSYMCPEVKSHLHTLLAQKLLCFQVHNPWKIYCLQCRQPPRLAEKELLCCRIKHDLL